MSEITTVGVDLAKDVIVVCASNAAGAVVLRKQLSFSAFAAWAANIPGCVIGMEACSTAHHWVRVLASLGHSPKLMAAEVVAPFRMSRGAKNDHNDAEAILVAVQSADDALCIPEVDRAAGDAVLAPCAGGVPAGSQVTAEPHSRAAGGVWHLAGQVRGGTDPQDAGAGEEQRLPICSSPSCCSTLDHLRQLDQRASPSAMRAFAEHVRHSEEAQRSSSSTGVGVLTASAVLATVLMRVTIRNGRQLAAWAGLVPRQNSSGGKNGSGQITRVATAISAGF